MKDLMDSYPLESLILILLIGILFCFWGRKFLKIIMIITSFCLLYYLISYYLSNDIIFAIICGIIGAAAVIFLFKVGIFIIGAASGILLGITVESSINIITPEIVILLFAIICGVLALWMEKFIIIMSTSLIGASAIVNSLHILFRGATVNEYNMEINITEGYNFLIICILTIIGYLFQYKIFKKIKQSINEKSLNPLKLNRNELFMKHE